MSTVILIDQDTGIIKRELIAYASYREEGLLTVKPRNPEEERLWRQFSANNEKIAALKSEVEELARQVEDKERLEKEAAQTVAQMFSELEKSRHEKYCPGELKEIQAEWDQAARTLAAGHASQALAAQAQQTLQKCRMLKRKVANVQLKEAEGQRRTEESLKRICGKLTAMETVCLRIQTDEGTETVDAPADLLTNRGLQALRDRLDEMVRRGLDGGAIRQEDLDALEQDADKLPSEVQDIYVTHTIRLDEAEAVKAQLLESGWKVETSMGERVSDDVVFYLENPARERAVIAFPLRGGIRIESPHSWDAARRRALQMLVMRTLKLSGVPGLHGHCKDGTDPDIWEEDIELIAPVPAASTSASVPVRSRTARKSHRTTEAGGSTR